jgi:hypothetical protein
MSVFDIEKVSRVVSGIKQKNCTSVFKATKGLTASQREIDCNQTAMGLPLATSAVFLTAKSYW